VLPKHVLCFESYLFVETVELSIRKETIGVLRENMLGNNPDQFELERGGKKIIKPLIAIRRELWLEHDNLDEFVRPLERQEGAITQDSMNKLMNQVGIGHGRD